MSFRTTVIFVEVEEEIVGIREAPDVPKFFLGKCTRSTCSGCGATSQVFELEKEWSASEAFDALSSHLREVIAASTSRGEKQAPLQGGMEGRADRPGMSDRPGA